MTKIIFLDIDGPMIPGRSFIAAGKTEIIPFEVQDFDPVAVGMLSRLCQEDGWRIVIHSSWISIVGGERTYEHCLKQGISGMWFYAGDRMKAQEDAAWCDEKEPWRYTKIAKYLEQHPEITDYVILDDTDYQDDLSGYPHPKDMQEHWIPIDFDDGLLVKHYNEIQDRSWFDVRD